MRGAEVDAGSDLESSCMLRQRGIGVRQDHRAQLLIAGRIDLTRTDHGQPSAGLLELPKQGEISVERASHIRRNVYE